MALKASFPRDISRAMLFVAIFAITITSLVPLANAQPPQQAGNVAPQKTIETLAVVNGQPITRHQIADECMRRYGQDVLESRIKKLLVLEQCKKSGVVITEKDVNDELANTAKKFGMSGEKYVQMICSRKKISVDRLKNDITWHDLAIRRLASQNIQVTPEELNERMEFEFGSKIQVRQIVVDSLQQANQIHEQLMAAPDNFERMAKQFSIDPQSKSMGGLLQPIRRNSGLPAFEDVAFALQPKEISKVFPIANNFIILQCQQKFPATTLSREETDFHHERLISELTDAKLLESARMMFTHMQKTAQIVNVMNDPKLSQQMPGVAATVNGVKILNRDVGEDCIARFGSMMLETEINRAILMQALKKANLQVSKEDITTEITRAAQALGHLNEDGTADVNDWLNLQTNNDASRVDFYIEDEVWPTVALKKLVQDSVSVSQEDMDKGFEANFGPRVEVLVIVNKDQRDAQKVWNLATNNQSAEYFGKLANQYSIEPASKNNYGVVPPIARHTGRPKLEEVAFRLQRDEISKVVQVGEYWITMYCMGRTDPVVSDFDAVKEDLHNDILEKKLNLAMGESFRKLREESQIDNFLAGTSQPGLDAVRSARQLQNQNRQPQTPFKGTRR
jgi:parvulin-like peptidyl-prolyl isomerase